MARIFAYIVHKDGVTDDSAFELAAAAHKIDAAASPTAILTGWGADLDAACNALGDSYPEIWKIANEALAYPNAELVRKALLKVLPSNSIVLIGHEHFGIDLAPGLSIKMNSAFVSDVLEVAGVEGADIKVIRQEFGGQIGAHVRCDFHRARCSPYVPARLSRRRLWRDAASWSTNQARSALLQRVVDI